MTRPHHLRHRRPAAAALAAALALLGTAATAGCGSGNDDADGRARPTTATTGAGGQAQRQTQEQARPLAVIEGQHQMLLTITGAVRDPGGFLTVRGTLANQGAQTLEVPAGLRGNESKVLRNGQSLGGATLVDYRERKRYYVLRDTDGRPLTTTSVDYLKSGESIPVFMQFPQPPDTTREVGFQLPQFDTATIRIGP
ncbi:hypothetical protein ABZZ79_36175 [Streptomyces sp. NPDC006458]|uniref:hypothetical protein n=1 Tax=Streptomyces sp. NPDC006458 TaxID=3154302 RepID=UPI0033B0A3FD